MDDAPLYQQIAESLRRDILDGRLKPGTRLLPVRLMAAQWGCTPGTVQRAYQELAAAGLVTGRAGQGTHVTDVSPARENRPLQRAGLVHRAEAYLLEVLAAGFSLDEANAALSQAMDRWRAATSSVAASGGNSLRFVGSHDLALSWLASRFPEIAGGSTLQLKFTGSLGGLIALAERQADLAGSHLWDEESDSYNAPFVRRLFPGKRMALVTLAQRCLGLILLAGNPAGISGLADLARAGIRFANRQAGSGTRVWLDAALRRQGIPHDQISGYGDSLATHTAVAQAVAEGRVDVGFGLEAAARFYGLDFILLTHDIYDLVIPGETMENPAIRVVLDWLSGSGARELFASLGGYDTAQTGQVLWVG